MDQEKRIGNERFILLDTACARFGMRKKQLLQLAKAHKIRRFEEPVGPARAGKPVTVTYVCEADLVKALAAETSEGTSAEGVPDA